MEAAAGHFRGKGKDIEKNWNSSDQVWQAAQIRRRSRMRCNVPGSSIACNCCSCSTRGQMVGWLRNAVEEPLDELDLEWNRQHWE